MKEFEVREESFDKKMDRLRKAGINTQSGGVPDIEELTLRSLLTKEYVSPWGKRRIQKRLDAIGPRERRS